MKSFMIAATTLLLQTAEAAAPVDQSSLNTWWSASKAMWIGEDAYEAKGTTYSDGQCSASFTDGIIIPVYTGKPPLTERVVGVLFIGEGELRVDLPRRADAWSFANHMVMTGEKTVEEMAPIARSGMPYETGIERAMILSADPAVEQMLLDKMPVGSGVYRRSTDEGVNEEFVVTESRGKLKAKVISTNLLPQRRLLLERAGLDPLAMLRQDRLMHEELGFPTGQLRRIADFRTTDRFHVAAHEGAGVGPTAFDSWLTCFNDPLGQSDTGERSVVFAHGEDVEGKRHFQRLAGAPHDTAKDELVPRPAVMMEAVHAESVVTMKPVQRRNYMGIEVESLLTVKAKGGALQHVALALPTEGSPIEQFKLLSVETDDGTPLAHVGLHADSAFFARGSEGATADAASTAVDGETEASEGQQFDAPEIAGMSGPGAGGGQSESASGEGAPASASTMSSAEDVGSSMELETVSTPSRDFDLITETAFNYEILVLLPAPVAEGETTKIRVKWKSRWKNNNRTFAGRFMGSTTSANRFLPELLPSPGGTAWDARTTLHLAPARFFPLEGAVSGTTISEETGDDGWRTIVAEARQARAASLGTGKWVKHSEEPAEGLPGVSVALMSTERRALGEFPPEIRRVVSFMQRFLPKLDVDEIEVFQGPAMLPSTAQTAGFRDGRAGLINLRNVKTFEVGDNTEVQKRYPALTQNILARQVAHQYWGQRSPPNSSRDLWLTEALSDAYGAFYVRAGLGKETWDQRLKWVGRRLENPINRGESDDVKAQRRPLSLTEPAKFTDIGGLKKADFGFYLLAHTLRERIGSTAFFLGLDRLAQRRNYVPLATEDLQAIFEETSGQDLADFFDFWIHGGRIPKVEITYALAPDEEEGKQVVHGCVTSDVPFGSFDVPVTVEDGMGAVSALVDVDDGVGQFTVPARTGEVSVIADRKKELVLYARKVKQVVSREKLTCQ